MSGWAYALVHHDTVLLAESGVVQGSASHGEYMAVIQGLLAVPAGTPVRIITDRNDIGDIIENPTHGKSMRKMMKLYRDVVRQLASQPGVSHKVIKSNGHPMHKAVDAMARHACGLSPKRNKGRRLTSALTEVE